MELQMLYRNTLSKMPEKKLLFEPKILRSYINYNPLWLTFLAFL